FEFEDKLRQRIEAYLDKGHAACYLSNIRIGKIVQHSILHFDQERSRLASWVIMPNHVHLLAAPTYVNALSSIMHSLKSYTSQEANKILGRKGQFWFSDYFDRYRRNASHFDNTINYIENNPVRAGLCNFASDWPWGSARFRVRKHVSR